ncbi:MAG TPA: DUF1127 domain-containing protein [Terriglobia bacterium]|nr:DUF1127 domain-containing protein [Terriglobia bacterium]
MQKQSAVNSVAEEVDIRRTYRRSEWTISYRFPVQRSLPVDQFSGCGGDPRQAPSGVAAKPAWLSRFFSRMAEQMINDFASAAAAMHPEALLLMGGEAGYDEVARIRRDDRAPLYRHSEPRVEPGSRYPQVMRAHPQSPAASAPDRRNPGRRNPVPVDAQVLGWGGWIMSQASALQARIQNAREARHGLAALRSLDDRMLKDIGVARHEIERLARHGR